MKPTTLLTAALAVACLAVPATASAGTVSSDGSAVVFTGTAGAEALLVDIDFDGNASFSGSVDAGPGCQPNGFGLILCPLGAGGLASMTLNTGGGDDHVKSLITTAIPPRSLRLDLGDGNDTFIGQDAAEVVDGGGGDDDLTTFGGADELLGGDGVDKLNSGAGADVLRGGPGNDTFSPDIMGQRAADVIDGGPGIDAVDDWVPHEDPATAAPARVTLDGQANDGFAGEGDNVIAVEAVKAGSALVFTGDGEANRAVAAEVGGPSELRGEGGDDVLEGGDRADEISGGAGADEIQGGFGSDTIVPGPGRDAVAADRPGRCNEMHCDLSPGLSNDTVEARDGETDQIACGPGVDTVRADRADIAAADCEHVERGGTAPQGNACVVPKLRGLKLKAAKRKLARAGCSAKVRRAGHRKVKPGRVIKASAKAGRRLRRGAKVTLTVSRGRAGAAAARVKFKRMTLTVDITGLQLVDWHWESEGYDDPAKTWDYGLGTQTYGYSTRKPIRMYAYIQKGRVNGKKIDTFGLAPVSGRMPLLRTSLTREHEWYVHYGPPVCEGGPQYCPDDGVDEQPTFECPKRQPKARARLSKSGILEDVGVLDVELGYDNWKNCPPDQVVGGPADSVVFAEDPRALVLFGEVQRKIERLRRGRSFTWKLHTEVGSNADSHETLSECPVDLPSRKGFTWCRTSDVTTKIRRVG